MICFGRAGMCSNAPIALASKTSGSLWIALDPLDDNTPDLCSLSKQSACCRPPLS